MRTDNSSFKEEYKYYTLGLALFDAVPVIIFLLSGIIVYFMSGSIIFLAGTLCSFAGGMSKVIWKAIVAVKKRDIPVLTRIFHILMPAGFALMLLAAIVAAVQGEGGGIWQGLTMIPAGIFFLMGFACFFLMGWLGSHMDDSAKSNWTEQSINTIAQILILAGVISVYFGSYYHATQAATDALEGTDTVKVSEIDQGYYFDGAGEDDIIVFYPGALVEATSYAPLMSRIAEGGTDCILCRLPLNFALFGMDTASEVREDLGDSYQNWYLAGHSLGGVAASMLAADTDAADDEDAAGDTYWSGMIFLASYPTNAMDIPVLSVYGSRDGVLNMEKYDEAGAEGRWPEDFTEVVIEGGNHAQFGSYGEQEGDKAAAISAESQCEQAAAAIQLFIGSH